MLATITTYPSLLRRLALLDYPLPLKIHAYLLLGLGAGLTFAPQFVVTSPFIVIPTRLLGLPQAYAPPNPKNPSRRDQLCASDKRNLTLAGLLALGLGLSYVGTSAFVPRPEDNQLMYGAIPLRFIMSFAALLSWIVDKEARSMFKLTIIVEDFLGATWLAWWMRDWPLWKTFVV